MSARTGASWPRRWRAMIDYLEARAPCIYIPNYDWQYSCVVPRLSKRVGVVGIVHSDDPAHYEHIDRLGAYWNAVVWVSPAIAEHLVASYPGVSNGLTTLPYGVAVFARVLPARPVRANSPLRLLYAGRLNQHQKRVLDLPAMVRAACAAACRSS